MPYPLPRLSTRGLIRIRDAQRGCWRMTTRERGFGGSCEKSCLCSYRPLNPGQINETVIFEMPYVFEIHVISKDHHILSVETGIWNQDRGRVRRVIGAQKMQRRFSGTSHTLLHVEDRAVFQKEVISIPRSDNRFVPLRSTTPFILTTSSCSRYFVLDGTIGCPRAA